MVQAPEIESGRSAGIIVGLGNPGRRYSRNRHNIGFMVLDALARESDGKWSAYLLSEACSVEIGGRPGFLVKPLTYMNHSGKAVHAVLSALGRSPQDLVLVVDDLNLPFGRIRIRERGSSGGHRGLESVFALLDTDDIVRIRVGIGEEGMPEDKTDFVLSDFPPEKETELNEMILKTGDAVKSIMRDGVSKTMAIFNA
jgi:PTH1 family peptidyl-tRNA hydrolase